MVRRTIVIFLMFFWYDIEIQLLQVLTFSCRCHVDIFQACLLHPDSFEVLGQVAKGGKLYIAIKDAGSLPSLAKIRGCISELGKYSEHYNKELISVVLCPLSEQIL